MARRTDVRSQFKALTKGGPTDQHARRGCGKVGYPSKRVADGRARVLGKRAYKCEVCKRWHLASR